MTNESGCELGSEAWLSAVLADFECQTGTLHRADGEWLDLVVAQGVPEQLMPMVTRIPFGKGIAGEAASTREPVELCNLQQDLGGVAKPDARKTGVSGSLAVPVFSTTADQVIGTLGVGMTAPYEFSPAEKNRLAEIAREVAVIFENNEPGGD